ncbi:DUF523 domain-containing protein [Tepidibacter hydrothermalis]|uniref:DUF523 domain-containing protein n=1 Tax=Tepidibacter hydrothermalis TaxID=3036126 RepID=A0ABY8E995_9FIRM|nr:DUF523 domain-containing protein [Tepidibacter hydrothermalis]WFD09488.1 DUF523 domain-containing protein [Tepidibacter hydrothermalis]
MILVSACLIGVDCKYNGGNNKNDKLMEYLKDKMVIPVCPEQLGGLCTPRIPAEIVGGSAEDVIDGKAKVINKENQDVTEEFLKGAYETLKICRTLGIKKAVLKEKSPSCGTNQVYDGSFKSKIIDGYGITAVLLIKDGIDLKSEKYFEGGE